MNDGSCLLILLFLIWMVPLMSGCDEEQPPAIALQAEQSVSDGVPVLSLSHTPREIRGAVEDVIEVESDLVLGGEQEPEDEAWFGAAVDVAAFDDGHFAVFDRVRSQILMFDSTGTLTTTYGGKGDGPGEYRHPYALERVGDHLVAWDGGRSATALTILTRDGHVRSTTQQTASGDWHQATFRSPYINVEGTQRGSEDVTRRLAPYDDSSFLVFLQFNELQDQTRSYPDPPAHVIRYGLDGRVRDTVVNVAGAPTTIRDRINENIVIYEQKLFVGRPVFATGDGWLATGHGDSTQVTVRSLDGDTIVTVRWPARRRAPTEEDRLEAAKWILAIRVANSPNSRRIWEGDSRRERREGIEVTAFEHTPFADSIPHLTAAYGHGSCLFLSGFSPEGWPDGTGLTWLVIDIRRKEFERILEFRPRLRGEPLILQRRGFAMRDFTGRHAFGMSRDGDGLFYIHRFPLPPLQCMDRPDPSHPSVTSNGGERP